MKQYLPMGSVVLLKDGKRKLLIIGRLQKRKDTNEIHDYAALLYPVGNIDNNLYLFNERDIEEVVFRGYCDIEEQNYIMFLNESIGTQN